MCRQTTAAKGEPWDRVWRRQHPRVCEHQPTSTSELPHQTWHPYQLHKCEHWREMQSAIYGKSVSAERNFVVRGHAWFSRALRATTVPEVLATRVSMVEHWEEDSIIQASHQLNPNDGPVVAWLAGLTPRHRKLAENWWKVRFFAGSSRRSFGP